MSGPPTSSPRRAPRLGPHESIADLFTRSGRFARIDPRQGRRLPRPLQLVGVVAWAALTGESYRRAWKASREVEG